ncbi:MULTISPECIES: hypothetical protein [unclassified Spirosoma]|uniref:hypothetical protein n=1 Tax=unclassified Spirosoma TaxID=2621999 RepID=UPI000A9DBDD3|nr:MULTISPECIES: hypothetical protein [unclassified Spirosoma]MBN8822357.1 hypothetical protein [Spirosoma sp.]
MLVTKNGLAQSVIRWESLPLLPDSKGRAGMFAGVSNGAIIAIGGANFPDAPPWEGGKKKWYDDIFVLETGKKSWIKSTRNFPRACGYGVSITYNNQLIVIGGSNPNEHLNQVVGVAWNGTDLVLTNYPSLPYPLAQMGGFLVDDMIVLIGGNQSATSPPMSTCLILDLKNLKAGWQPNNTFSGVARIFPICGVYHGEGYLFSGETQGINAKGNKFRDILLDAYQIQLKRNNNTPLLTWQKLAPMPRGMSAGGGTVPLLNDNQFFFWGGVDAVTAGWKNPAKHPGIIRSMLIYKPESDEWTYLGEERTHASRVTLPVVYWQGLWVYVSGETFPGVRTPSVIGVRGK